MQLGYITNGLAHHAPMETLRLLASIGYRSVGVTIDHGVLDPAEWRDDDQSADYRQLAEELGLTITVETGARFLLDRNVKHEPTMVSPDFKQQARRVDFYYRCIEQAQQLGSRCVSLWSGVVHDNAPKAEAMNRLVESLANVLKHAAAYNVLVAFEPEPGMLIETLADYRELKKHLAEAGADLSPLRLTIDIGHLHCNGEVPITKHLVEWQDEIVNLHIEDMRAGVHEHLPFGEGEIDFPPIIAALKYIGYEGPLNVELSRHSHVGPTMARQAFDFLSPLLLPN